jgi:hypothetical protein
MNRPEPQMPLRNGMTSAGMGAEANGCPAPGQLEAGSLWIAP